VLDASLSPRRKLSDAIHDTDVRFVFEAKETARADCLIARPASDQAAEKPKENS